MRSFKFCRYSYLWSPIFRIQYILARNLLDCEKIGPNTFIIWFISQETPANRSGSSRTQRLENLFCSDYSYPRPINNWWCFQVKKQPNVCSQKYEIDKETNWTKNLREEHRNSSALKHRQSSEKLRKCTHTPTHKNTTRKARGRYSYVLSGR